MKLSPRVKRRLLWIIHGPNIIINKYVTLPKQEKKIREILSQKSLKTSAGNSLDDLSKLFFLATSFRIASEERLGILKTTLLESLKNFIDTQPIVKFKIADASDLEYARKIENILQQYNGLKIEYSNKSERLNSAYHSILSTSNESYFCMVFDDFPIIGMTLEFIKASCKLLSDFDGLVDLIFMEHVSHSYIDHANKMIYYTQKGRALMKHKKDIVGVVTYNGYRFAIVKNFYYGFFFNTIIARSKQYSEKLFWYMNHVDHNSPHSIELAGSLRIGPIYNYIAIPIEVINMDLDYSHTETSIRKSLNHAEELYKAFTENYTVRSSDEIEL